MTVLLGIAALAGCGGGATSTPSSTEPAETTSTSVVAPSPPTGALASCDRAGKGWRDLHVSVGGARVDAATLGDGPVGVTFANDSGNDACSWVPFAEELADRGLRVLVYHYEEQDPRELAAMMAALRGQGSARLIAIGASLGGRLVIELAAREPKAADAVVSISGERSIGAYPDILPDARRVELPILYVGSREDGYTTFGKETVQLHDATPARVNELLLVPGADHGVDLLAGRNGERVRGAILQFLAQFGD